LDIEAPRKSDFVPSLIYYPTDAQLNIPSTISFWFPPYIIIISHFY